jgi:hypothetical protein
MSADRLWQQMLSNYRESWKKATHDRSIDLTSLYLSQGKELIQPGAERVLGMDIVIADEKALSEIPERPKDFIRMILRCILSLERFKERRE